MLPSKNCSTAVTRVLLLDDKGVGVAAGIEVTGAGSVVTKDVPAETVVVGNPARPLRKRKKPKGDG